jgi:hypothetical protein
MLPNSRSREQSSGLRIVALSWAVYAALKRRTSTGIAGNTNNSRSLHSAVADAPAPVGMTGVFALSKTR